MKRIIILVFSIVSILFMAGCPNPSDGNGGGTTYRAFAMNYVPGGGSFTMGEDVESTTQTVTLTKSFWMGETEVTQGLWEDIMGTTWPGTNPDGSGFGFGDDYPAYNVNWYDAVEFCNALTIAEAGSDTNCVYYSDSSYTTVYTSGTTVYADLTKTGYRLPTEAEWEYAARYMDGSNWNGGDHVSGDTSEAYDISTVIGNFAWYNGNNSGSSGDPTYGSKEVGQKTANALGLYDMSGNVFEWCNDWFASYSGSTEIDPEGAENGSIRVLRGGSWDFSGSVLRCALRDFRSPSGRFNFIGIRLCRTAN